jgi:hypothetical protein
MKRFLSLALFLLMVAGTLALMPGCKSSSGSRDYIPGKGWVPND